MGLNGAEGDSVLRAGARRLSAAIVALTLGLAAYGPATPALADPPTHETGYIPVATGTDQAALLHYKVMLPDPTVWGPGPFPAVIDYSGYLPAVNVYDGLDDRFVGAGYAVVGLNIRGTGCSSGKFDYFEPVQARDGAEAIEWLAERDWSNGRFAMVGKSYPGITQAFVAAERPEPLKAIVPGHIFADLYRDVPFPGGIMNATFAGAWSAQRVYEGNLYGPVHTFETQDAQCALNQRDHVANPAFNPLVRLLTQMWDGPIFRERSPWEFADRIDVPVFLIESWQDEQVGSRGTHLLERLRPELPWRFLATNGDHGEYYGDRVFPEILRFLSYHLKQEVPAQDVAADPDDATSQSFEDALDEYLDEDPVTINWENGAAGGRLPAWTETYEDWPVPDLEEWRLNLSHDGGLTEDVPDAGTTRYSYVPVAGSQERGGQSIKDLPPASWSDRPPEGTFASFTTQPLESDHVLLGSASLDLWLSSTAPDTDVEVTLSEVRPDGQEVFVQQGWLRASHRAEDPNWSTELRPFQTHLLADSLPLVPGQPSLLRVEIFPFGHAFRAGSKVRVSVAAPHVKPDLWGFATLPVPAVNSIYTGGAFRSSLVLPLIDEATAEAGYPTCGTLRNQPCRSDAGASTRSVPVHIPLGPH